MVDNTLSTLRDGLPTVQLRHTLPDHTSHIDWMIAQDPSGEQPLWTFRMGRRIDEISVGESVELQHLPDHRPQYLRYEGSVSGDRGEVRQLISGQVKTLERGRSTWRLEIVWPTTAGRVVHQSVQIDFLSPGDAVATVSAILTAEKSETCCSSTGDHSTR